jgi:hypothetical protein
MTPEVLTRVTDTIREMLLHGGDNGLEEEDLVGTIQDWEQDEENPEMAIVSIELFDDGRDDGKPGWYSREFTFTECGIVSRLGAVR